MVKRLQYDKKVLLILQDMNDLSCQLNTAQKLFDRIQTTTEEQMKRLEDQLSENAEHRKAWDNLHNEETLLKAEQARLLRIVNVATRGLSAILEHQQSLISSTSKAYVLSESWKIAHETLEEIVKIKTNQEENTDE